MQAAASGQPTRPLDVIAPVALRHLSDVRLFAPGAERPVEVEVAASARQMRRARCNWRRRTAGRSRPRHSRFGSASAGESVKLAFNVQGPVRAGHGRHRGRGSRGRRDVEQRADRDQAPAYPRAVAAATRAPQGRGARPCDEGPARRLHSRRRRPRRRGARGNGLRGHPARRCGPHARETARTSTAW